MNKKLSAATVTQVWNPGTEFEMLRDLSVTLERAGDQWLISGIGCPPPG